mgnify:CR=1 FL=1|tara:strand:+ start:11976 stop:12188 length:213 start_codon:yes stop_codon:yes gene_type:complete
MKRTVNITIEIDDFDMVGFESQLRQWLKVIDFTILPDSKDLYNTDPIYKKMWKKLKEDKKAIYNYIKDNT